MPIRSHLKLIGAVAACLLVALTATGMLAERRLRLQVAESLAGSVAGRAELVEITAASFRRELLVAGVLGLTAVLTAFFALAWSTRRPLRKIRQVAASIADGDLSTRLPLHPGDELGQIAQAINQMAERLHQQLEVATREKEQLQAVLDGMVEGVLVLDATGRVILANRRLREIFDAWGEVLGRPPLEAIRDADLDAFLTDASETDEPVSRLLQPGPGSQRTLSVHATRFPADDRPRAGTVAVFHDVTEIHRLENVRRDFVANASHELRTPLSAIRGFAETLLSDEALRENDRRSYLEIINRHAERLAHIVGDLLVLSDVESGSADQELASVDVAALADTLIRDSQARFDDKGLSVSLQGDAPALAWSDAQALEQILTNLLSNAVQYTDSGGKIDVAVRVNPHTVGVSVTDTGIGIPEHDLDRIFERFYRVDKARSRALGGTGLGLSIVKHLVQSVGGTLTVESELGVGSCFRISLPAPPPRDETRGPGGPDPDAPGSPPPEAPSR